MDNMTDKWYQKLTYTEAKGILSEKLMNIRMDFIAIGYYLKYIRDRELYQEDGYRNIWEFAEDNYGIRRTTASRWMLMNDRFSVDGNTPTLSEEYRAFGKSQLQEMLYLENEQMEQVTPGMTVKEIRNLKEESKEEPVSILGYPLRVYPEDSLIATPGCGKQDCCSCHRDGCEIRQVDCYCVEAPMGNPFPCTTLNVVDRLRDTVKNHCQFVNEDLAFHRAVAGQPVPCCKECNDPCEYECSRSVQARREKEKQKQEKMCDVAQKEEQLPGQTDLEDFPEVIPEEAGAERIGYRENDDRETERITEKGMENSVPAAAGDECGDLCNDDWEEEYPTDLAIIRKRLDREKRFLNLCKENLAEDDIQLREQKLLVGAIAGFICDLEDDIYTPEQPELPCMKNNDERKEWLKDYKNWGLWYEDKNTGVRYYKYDFENGARLIAEVYQIPRQGYIPEHEMSYLHLIGGPEPPAGKCGTPKWNRHERYTRLSDTITELVEFLKYSQNRQKTE